MTQEHPFTYVVLTETDDIHHVVIRRTNGTARWLQIAGTFPNKTRAISYADIENMMLGEREPLDGIDDDDLTDAPPQLIDGGGRMWDAIEMTRVRAIRGPVSERQRTENHQRDQEVRTLADDIVEHLPTLVEQFPMGPTAKIIAAHVSADEYHVRKAIRELDKSGRAVLMRRRDSPSHHLVPLGYDPPLETLTPTQRAVLIVMQANASANGIVKMSKRDIAQKAICSLGTIQAVIDALVYKRRIAGVSSGTGTITNAYKIVRAEP